MARSPDVSGPPSQFVGWAVQHIPSGQWVLPGAKGDPELHGHLAVELSPRLDVRMIQTRKAVKSQLKRWAKLVAALRPGYQHLGTHFQFTAVKIKLQVIGWQVVGDLDPATESNPERFKYFGKD